MMERPGAPFALSNPPAATAAATFRRFPPPYRLVCDLALLLLFVEADVATRWAEVPVLSLLGRAPLLVMLARYYRAEYGPERRPLLPPEGDSELYKEVACALLVKGSRGSEMTFPHLWLESPAPIPLELGWHYGFPKYEASLTWVRNGRAIRLEAQDDRGSILSFKGSTLGRLPVAPVVAASAFRGVFPITGRQAPMWFESARRVSFLYVRQFTAPRLEPLGRMGRSPLGLWLEQATLFLGSPVEPLQDRASAGP